MRALVLAPPLDGPATGGTLYNLQLMAAVDPGVLALQHAPLALGEPVPAWSALATGALWVDSLYLAEVPQLRAAAQPGVKLGLLLHYLPSLLAREPAARRALEAGEQRALLSADWVVTTSSTMCELVQKRAQARPCSVIEPGVQRAAQTPGLAARERSALLLCNVTENKGVLPLLEALAARAGEVDDFALHVAGRMDLEPAYTERCRRLVHDHAWLRAHVRWLGGLAPEEVQTALQRAGVLVSASRMESYGMALAEARATGTPILARAGGHVAAHVAADSGGELVTDEAALARALLALMRSASELSRRQRLAAANIHARSWGAAAREFEHVNRQLLAL